MYKRALISVYDKTGLEELLKPLVKQGLEIVSTGGTAQFLKSKGFQLEEVKNLTSFPELLGGRVKTLHPNMFIPLLAREWMPEDQEVLKNNKLKAFDLLIVNLYPFESKAMGKKDKEKVEWIDIGGPSLLRAGAKNYFSIMTVCEPQDYSNIQQNNDVNLRKKMAIKVFQKLSEYNHCIAQNLEEQTTQPEELTSQNLKEQTAQPEGLTSQNLNLKAHFLKKLRYGENPHQTASWFTNTQKGLHLARVIQGKELSYNNILDFEASLHTLRDFYPPCVVAVKHNNPCGVAVANDLSTALKKALVADPLSVFGGILAFNQTVDSSCANQVKDIFLEGVLAPSFTQEALEILKKKKQLRVLEWPEMLSHSVSQQSTREIMGGFLLQTKDKVDKEFQENWEVFGENPSDEVKQDLIFAWKVCAHLKSNAISIVKNKQTLGLGMGQVNRVDAVHIALNRAEKFHSKQKKGLILASDAFFPFVDSIELAQKKGISWIIQPGGSIRDKEILDKCSELKLNMILTKKRHFKH